MPKPISVSGRKAKRPDSRYVGAWVPLSQWSAIGAIAAQAGTSRAAMLREMIADKAGEIKKMRAKL